jgi:hypothetical protein
MKYLPQVLQAVCSTGLALALIGCSQQAQFEMGQAYTRDQCLDQPPATYDDCLAAASQSYDEYMREREAVINDE